MGIKIPDQIPASSTNGTLTAILAGLSIIESHHNIDIKTDDALATRIMSVNLTRWEDEGFVALTNKPLLKSIATRLRKRTGITTISEIRDVETRSARTLAKNGLDNLAPQVDRSEDLRIQSDLVIWGAKMTDLTQARAYRLIHETKNIKTRCTTEQNIALIQSAILLLNNYSPTEAQIWCSIQNTDLLQQQRNFLYLAVHGTQKLGDFWLRIPDYREWGTCHFCNETKTMQHILFECHKPGQAELWNLAQLLWVNKKLQWPQMTLGLALGCGLVKFHNADGRLLLGATRLFRVLVAETVHTIWKIRCDIVLKRNNVPMAAAQVHNMWVHALNERLKTDCLMTNQSHYGKRALNSDLVLCTWSGTLRDEINLPDSWIMEPKVLVGIEPITLQHNRRPRDCLGRNR
ncbi:hypothetical protein C8J56DRAFT_807628 [Mycena floridula]|nr:hypothetical protein C8J56DRAFT_807628 [Mycena floridula]